MADVKISALPPATTPLTGSEVLPIVQGGTTDKVSVADLTAGRAVNTGDLTADGNVAITGTARRITGDFSNNTTGIFFQSSVINGQTVVGAFPNGTGTVAAFRVWESENQTNSSFGDIRITGAIDFRLTASRLGTGTFLPMTFFTGGSERMRIDASGNVGIGTSSPSAKLHLLTPSATSVALRAGNSVSFAEFQVDASGNSQLIAPGGVQIFNTNGAERMRIDSAGNVGIGVTTPNFKLQLHQSLSPVNYFQITNSSSGSGAGDGMLVGTDSAADAIVWMQENANLKFATSNTERMRITATGNVVAGGSVALATTATDGFLYVPTCAGIPTGTPTAITGMAPIVVNTTNNKLYFYSGGAWRDAGP